MAEAVKEMLIQCYLGICKDLRDRVRGTCSTSSSLEEDEQQGNHDVDSHSLPEFSTSSTDFYVLKGERNGRRQLINQVANSASTAEKPQYLLNVTLRDLFLSKVLVHKQQCIQIAHAPIQQLVWHSWINLV